MKDRSIAVLPFVNMSADADNEYFCDGITEEIINALAKLDRLLVTSRTSAFFFKGKNIPITEIGKQLNVSTILEGSIRLSGNTIRITAQLIQAENDFHFWSETWDRKLDDIFAIQDEISLIIADKLREQFGHFEIQESLVPKQTESLDAYTLYLKGCYHSSKWNPEDVQTAMSLFEQALKLDPTHANSLVGLADCNSFLATCGFISFEEGWGKCAQLVQQALAINDQLPGAYYQLANLAFFTACDYRESFSLVTKAIQINPNHVASQQFLSFLYILAGKKEKAEHHLKKALSVDPLSQETQFYSAYFDYMFENFESSMQKLNACLKENPKNIPVHYVKTICLLKMNKLDDVINYFDTLPSEIVIIGEKIGATALAYALKQDEIETKKYVEMLTEQANGADGFTADSFLFLYYSVSKQYDKAFEWVKVAKENRSPLLLLRYSDPLTNPIQEDPRYDEFHKQLFPEDLFTIKASSKKKKALLDEQAINDYTKRLISYIEAEQAYLNPELSLRSLANEVDINPNQLSWLLNESIGKNFNEFVNHYRIESFKLLAKDPANANFTVMGMAYDSGFNSKTVFNTYFKKETGLTPKQYLNG